MSYFLSSRVLRTWTLVALAILIPNCSTESTSTFPGPSDSATDEDRSAWQDSTDEDQTAPTDSEDALATDSQAESDMLAGLEDASEPTDVAAEPIEDERPEADSQNDSVDESDVQEPIAPPDPLRILFVGNSFTFGGPVPTIVDILANDAGWPDPYVRYSAFGGESLQGHRGRPETLALVDEGAWDVVVLQEYSTRPTDGRGDPEQFKEDATWFHDRIKASSPNARVILFETWAREADHSYYPGSYDDPADMQAQLRLHYFDAAESWIPEHAGEPVVPEVAVAPVGDVWEQHLQGGEPLRLHYSDDWHAGTNGRYLNGLVIYATIYERAVTGLTAWELSAQDATRLQQTTDSYTAYDVSWGPDGTPPPVGLEPGQRIQVDFGGEDTDDAGWHSLDTAGSGTLSNLSTAGGQPSSVDLVVSDGFGGVNNQGLEANELGYPGSASGDSFYCGSFDNHTDGLTKPGQITLGGLDPADQYDIAAFASRSGSDGSLGRLTRYSIGGNWQDVEISDNTSDAAHFEGVQPNESGQITLDVGVSPAGTGRFCYLGVLEVIGR